MTALQNAGGGLVTLPPALAPLANFRRFVTYRLEPHPDVPGKTLKRPTHWQTGRVHDAHDDAAQCTFAQAAATGRPVGFVIDPRDGFWFLDIDHCLTGGSWSALAVDLCTRLAGAAIEVSQSGSGLHLIGRGVVPPHACKNIALGLKLYTEKRFVALTGTMAAGDVMSDHSAAIAAIAAQYFPPNAHGEIAGWTDEPVPEWGGPADDAELLRAAMASGKRSAAAAFGDGVTFSHLWLADAAVLGKRWPGDKGSYDASAADAALAGHLAFWTGKNCERIRSLMLQSGLARQKWEDRPEWLEVTIMRACAVVANVAKAREPVTPPGIASAAPGPPPSAAAAPAGGAPPTAPSGALRVAGREFLSPVDQAAFFAGCVYVVDTNRIWIPSTGDLLDKSRFDVVYAGHVFPLDSANDKLVDSAFDAFTKSRVLSPAIVYGTCFRPEERPGAIVMDGNRSYVNTYVPIETKRLPGDAAPFLDHLGRMLPVGNDRAILLNYMASLVQNPGVKFQWWPVIQGVEGNGKTLIDRVLAHAVGSRYSHLVNPAAMAKTANQFNGWVQGNLYLGIEEIYVDNRRDFLDSFKATVTNDRVPIERKGVDQGTGDNRINGVMFTNHRDAIPVTIDSRRYAIFYTAQQCAADLHRDGMGGDYFPTLYDWFYGRRAYASGGAMYGAAIVNDYLRTMTVDAALDPAHLSVRAPVTSSTASALATSLGRAEQEILDAIEECRPGFAGGWLSSTAAANLLRDLKIYIPLHKRPDLFESLGYTLHPRLVSGRPNNAVAPDHGRPRLYVTPGHLSLNLDDAAKIAAMYSKAQETAQNSATGSRFAK